MTPTRRTFLKLLAGSAAAAVLAPALPTFPLAPVVGESYADIVGQIRWMMNIQVMTPRRSVWLTGIAE